MASDFRPRSGGSSQNYNGNQRNNNRNNDNYRKTPEMKDTASYYKQLKDNGYYTDTEKKKLNPGFVVGFAKDIAANLDIDGGSNKNKRTQIRKYYDYLIRVSQKLERCGMDYTYVYADVAELIPKVNYALSRNVVSSVFVKFIEENVSMINDAKDFKAFTKHFEAIIAYMKKDTK